MPTYAAIVYSADLDWTAPEQREVMADYSAFGQAAAAVIRGGAALYPTGTATTVRVRGGKVALIGPHDAPLFLGQAEPRVFRPGPLEIPA